MPKHILDSAAARNISVYAITDNKGKLVGKAIATFGSTGSVNVGLWDWTFRPDSNDATYQQAKAVGYGYDKETAAFAGLKFGKWELKDHSDSFDLPKHSRGSKAPKGTSFANGLRGERLEEHLKAGRKVYVDEQGRSYSSLHWKGGFEQLRDYGFLINKLV